MCEECDCEQLQAGVNILYDSGASQFSVSTQTLICSLQITIFISTCDELQLVTEMKSEKMDGMKVMKTFYIPATGPVPLPYLLSLVSRLPQSHGTPSVILQLAMNQQGATSQQFHNMQRLPFVQGMKDSSKYRGNKGRRGWLVWKFRNCKLRRGWCWQPLCISSVSADCLLAF